MIIIKDENILLIRRVKNGAEYWVFPGGGIEEGESYEQALKREAQEELGTQISIGDKFYEDRWQKSPTEEVVNTFYFCEITGGVVGTGDGPEWQENGGYFGEYHLEWHPLSELGSLDLKPGEVRDLLINPALRGK